MASGDLKKGRAAVRLIHLEYKRGRKGLMNKHEQEHRRLARKYATDIRRAADQHGCTVNVYAQLIRGTASRVWSVAVGAVKLKK